MSILRGQYYNGTGLPDKVPKVVLLNVPNTHDFRVIDADVQESKILIEGCFARVI
jgi:hypothetical protein